MDSFCGTPFWDPQVSWNTTNPDLTPCFQETALIWIPCGFLWLASVYEVIRIRCSLRKGIPWTLFNICKVVLALILCATSAAELIRGLMKYFQGDGYPADYYSPFIKLITFILAISLMLFHRKKGIIASGVLFIFWLLLSIASLVNYRSILMNTFDENNFDNMISVDMFVIRMIYVPIVLGQLVLSCFADSKPEFLTPGDDFRNASPEYWSSFLSQLTFWWFNRLAILGFKKPLKQDDLWDLNQGNQTEYVCNKKFAKYWEPVAEKTMRFIVHEEEGRVEQKLDQKPERDLSELSVIWPLVKAFWPELLFASALKFIGSCLTFVNPIILDFLIRFMTDENEPYWRGFFYAGLMFFSSMTESMFNNQYEFHIYTNAMRMRSCLISTLYKKSLKLTSKKDFTTGEIVNLMSIDAQRIIDFVQIYNILWSAPLQIAISLYLLWNQLGIATMSGVGVMLLLLPFNAAITMKLRKLQFGLMKEKDKRIKLMDEILNGIKVLKLYAWETSFTDQVMRIRNCEINFLKLQAYYSAGVTFAFTCAPFFVGLASFATFVLIDSKNVLDANKAFVSLSLFNILRVPLALLPMLITFAAMFLVSLRRINKYLQSEELDANSITNEPDADSAISIEGGTFSWTKDDPQPTVKDINLKIGHKKLVAIVGTVGSGKSSLLSALLGDMNKVSGKANINGTVAYVPQQAWIQNATLQKNILFMKPMDERKYKKVISNCALEPDLEILAGGDLTEIGEKGINLSGGQKQRVSLARAVFADADIYLLDDPLSAVDSHVGKHIFDFVIGPKGQLKHKTRVLVTHKIALLPQVDEIIVMKDGLISEHGSYAELVARKGAFADFLVQFLTQNPIDEDSVDEDELKLIEEIAANVKPDLLKLISRTTVKSDSLSEESGEEVRRRKSSVRSNGSSKPRGSESPVKSPMKGEKGKGPSGGKLTEAEFAAVGSVKWKVYIDYIKSLSLWGAMVTLVSIIISNGFNIGTSLWLTEWSEDSLDSSKMNDTSLRDLRLGVYGGLGGAETLFILLSSISLNLAALRGSRILHNNMLVHILMAPMSFFDTTPLGRLLNRFSKDIDTADVTIRFNIRLLLITFFRAIVSFIIISLETPWFLVAVVPLGVLYYIVQKFYIATSRQLKRIESTSKSPIYSHFSETVTGSTSIRAYGVSQDFINECHQRVDFNHSSYYPSVVASRWLGVRLEFLGYIIVFLAALFAVVSRGSLSPGIAGLSISYALTITGTLNMLVRASSDFETNIVAVERCMEYTRTPVEAERFNEATKPKPGWPAAGCIKFDNYSTRYREGLDLVLRSVSCTLQPNERVGIVGRTGAGKSSLTLALFRLIEPVEGTIYIDDVDIVKLGLHDLRSKLTIIPQDPVLFTGTLRMNLDPFDLYNDDELWAALDAAHLKKFVASLDLKLSHPVTEGGDNLSAGQRQLVCLARALLRKSKVLVLDEATAAVDLETDELIQTTIRTQFVDCSIVTIAHRLNTILDYDRVIVMDKGRVAEFDNPKVLLQNSDSLFYAMAKDAGIISKNPDETDQTQE